MEVICFGLSHQTADVALREKFSIADNDLADAAKELHRMEPIAESVILSTCNRVELYAATDHVDAGLKALDHFLRARAGEHHYDSSVFYQFGSPQSMRHLFRVVSGLDSMVLGETEIFGQVKKAYSAAIQNGTTAKHLNKLFQRAFNVGKEVRSNTNITRGPVSVGSVAVDLAEKLFGRLDSCRVMVLGAGETGEQTARFFLSRGAKQIIVSNRSSERAMALAEQLGSEAVPFQHWHSHLEAIDILIGSTAASTPIVTKDKVRPVMAQRPDRPLFMIDLAVPRDVEPEVDTIEGVYRYDIDSLRTLSEASMAIRRQELAICEELIDGHVEEFKQWLAGASAPTPFKQNR